MLPTSGYCRPAWISEQSSIMYPRICNLSHRETIGLRGTGSALALSYLRWGRASAPAAGAVAVSARSRGGRVAIVSRIEGGDLRLESIATRSRLAGGGLPASRRQYPGAGAGWSIGAGHDEGEK